MNLLANDHRRVLPSRTDPSDRDDNSSKLRPRESQSVAMTRRDSLLLDETKETPLPGDPLADCQSLLTAPSEMSSRPTSGKICSTPLFLQPRSPRKQCTCTGIIPPRLLRMDLLKDLPIRETADHPRRNPRSCRPYPSRCWIQNLSFMPGVKIPTI